MERPRVKELEFKMEDPDTGDALWLITYDDGYREIRPLREGETLGSRK